MSLFFYICNEAKQNLEQGLLEHKTGLRPHPPLLNNLLLTVPRRGFCCGLFYLSVFVGFLFFFVFFIHFIYRTVLLNAVLIIACLAYGPNLT